MGCNNLVRKGDGCVGGLQWLQSAMSSLLRDSGGGLPRWLCRWLPMLLLRGWMCSSYCRCAGATGGLLSDLLLHVRYDAQESWLGEGAELVEQGLIDVQHYVFYFLFRGVLAPCVSISSSKRWCSFSSISSSSFASSRLLLLPSARIPSTSLFPSLAVPSSISACVKSTVHVHALQKKIKCKLF